ncbi:peptidase S8/S53 domain-containing protein [Paraphysoderma sedebokerense]|nr:peptidase S8/S53 domain-containing protein [Paraphysoderma sedebokerense]
MKASTIALLCFVYLATTATTAEAGLFRRAPKRLAKNSKVIRDKYIIELSSPPVAASNGQFSAQSIQNDHQKLRQSMRSAGIKFRETGSFTTVYNGISATLSEADAKKVANLQGVKNVWPVLGHSRDPIIGGNDVFVPKLRYAHNSTFVNKVQELGFTGKNIKVGIVDSGIDWGHPAFAVPGKTCTKFAGEGCRVKYGKDFVGDEFNGSPESIFPDNDPMDCGKNGHGTHVAGIVGGSDTEIRGVAPDVVFGAYRVFGCEGSTSDELIIMAMEQAAKDKMDVVNLSLGGGSAWASSPTAVAGTNLAKAGVIVVAAAGNSGDSHGLYQLGAPSIGKDVISVASFDNSLVSRKVMTVNGKDLPYSTGEGIDDFNKKGIAEATILPGSADSTVVDDGCKAFPQDKFKGKVALIRRGTCAFTDKIVNAQTAGAIGAIIYNNEPSFLSGFLLDATRINIPVAGISGDDGASLVQSSKAGDVTASFPAKEKAFAIPTAGQPSDFSSWGLGNDLEVKPDVGGIGGQVYSTWPRSSGKAYNTISGTSMASPYIAGTVAAYLQAFPKTNAQTVIETIQNTARPSLAPSNDRFANSVAKQGSGLVDALAFISSKTRVSPSRLALQDTPGNQMIKRQRITVKNNGNSEMKYTVEHLPAQSIIGKAVTSPTPLDAAARVTMSPSTLSLGPGQSGSVDITIIGDANWADSDRIVYSGYIKVIPASSDSGYSPIHVPYAGFKGSYDGLQPLSSDNIVLPEGTKLPSPSIVTIQIENGAPRFIPYDKKPLNLANGAIPAVAFLVNHPVRDITLSWVDAKTGEVVGIAGATPDAQPIGKGDTLPASLVAVGMGSAKACVPNSGSYKFKLTFESGFDDNEPAIHSWTSEAFEIDLSGQRGNCAQTVTKPL